MSATVQTFDLVDWAKVYVQYLREADGEDRDA